MKKEISRDAQLIAHSIFPFGERSVCKFDQPHKIHPRTRAALDELELAEMITLRVDRRIKFGDKYTYSATKKMPFPPRAWPRPSEADDSFPFLIP